MRSTQELREHFLALLNKALPRSSMFGGESFLRDCLHHISFIDQTEDILAKELQELEKRGAQNARGVAGAFFMVTGVFDGGSAEVASIFAEIAHRMGYLKVLRYLAHSEFARLVDTVPKLCNGGDRSVDQIVDELGEPSWSGGSSNPFYPCVRAYATDEPGAGWIVFDFWNDIAFDADNHPRGKYGSEQLLRDVRLPAATFLESFHFTAFGQRLVNPGPGDRSKVARHLEMTIGSREMANELALLSVVDRRRLIQALEDTIFMDQKVSE